MLTLPGCGSFRDATEVTASQLPSAAKTPRQTRPGSSTRVLHIAVSALLARVVTAGSVRLSMLKKRRSASPDGCRFAGVPCLTRRR
jgi:hypothetical protein